MFSMATLAYYSMSPIQREQYERDVRPAMRTETLVEDTCCVAAVYATLGIRTLDMMNWQDRSLFRWHAVRNGHVDCLILFLCRAGDAGLERDSQLCTMAAGRGELQCLQYLHEAGYLWDKKTTAAAAATGSLECLRYAHENGCEWDPKITNITAYMGHLACMQYAHENGCPWDPITCRKAASRGHLDCLQYAAEHGCPFERDVSLYAAMGGHDNCLQYALSRFDHDQNLEPGYWSEMIRNASAMRDLMWSSTAEIANLLNL